MQAAYEAITARDSRGNASTFFAWFGALRHYVSVGLWDMENLHTANYLRLFSDSYFCNPHSVTATHRLIAAYFDAKSCHFVISNENPCNLPL